MISGDMTDWLTTIGFSNGYSCNLPDALPTGQTVLGAKVKEGLLAKRLTSNVMDRLKSISFCWPEDTERADRAMGVLIKQCKSQAMPVITGVIRRKLFWTITEDLAKNFTFNGCANIHQWVTWLHDNTNKTASHFSYVRAGEELL